MSKRYFILCLTVLVSAFTFGGCAVVPATSEPGWKMLFDGTNLNQSDLLGNANWRLQDGMAVAEVGGGHLVSKSTYTDFQIKAEFWVDQEANSGIFIRCENPKIITGKSCYEVNIYDTRPDPAYGTGGIPDVAKASSVIKAANHWNTYEITAQGSHLMVVLNGVKTVDVNDSQHAKGHITLQYGGGVVKFRKLMIRSL